jgi:hypothetical protein
MYTPGTLLRLAREERKLSISDVKTFAKIRESAIVAMETDTFDKFPAAYMQTFLPAYADFIGVSQYHLAEAFKATLPEYHYLARSLYSRTLQQIAASQMRAEHERLNPSFAVRAKVATKKYAARVAVLVLAFALGWSVMTSDVSLIGTLFAGRFVATPEEMRGTPFTELTGESAASAVAQNNRPLSNESQPSEAGEGEQGEMKTIHLAALLNVDIDVEAVRAIAFKQTQEVSHSIGDALVHAVDDLTPAPTIHAEYDASRRSISSIASTMLQRMPDPRTEAALPREPQFITEAAVEQNSARNPKSGQILVAGIDNEPLNTGFFKRKQAAMRVVALTSSLRLAHSRNIPSIETVALKAVVIEPVQIIVPIMQPSLQYRIQQGALQPISMPILPVTAYPSE